MPPDPRVHVGVGAWVEHAGTLLMVRRGGTGPYACNGHGTWSIPGGWLDRGESIETAAVREVEEETGADVAAVGEPTVTRDTADDGSFDFVTLLVPCRWLGQRPPRVTEPDKCPEVRWVPLGEIADLTLFTPTARVVSRLLGRDPGTTHRSGVPHHPHSQASR